MYVYYVWALCVDVRGLDVLCATRELCVEGDEALSGYLLHLL